MRAWDADLPPVPLAAVFGGDALYVIGGWRGSLAARCYGKTEISERHRHRYEFNNVYRQQFTAHGMRFSGTSPDGSLVEVIELPEHPWFLAVQYHPEFKSKPTTPQPLFAGFIGAAVQRNRGRGASPAKKSLAKDGQPAAVENPV